MRRRTKILVVVAGLMLAAFTFMGIAGADEALADGTYTLTMPGIGTLTLNVAGSTVTVAAPGTAFDSQSASLTQDGEFVLTSPLLSINVEADDGALEGELRVDLGDFAPGQTDVTIGDLTFTVIVADDGSMSVTGLPDGYQVSQTEDGLKIVSADGTIKIEANDGKLYATVKSAESEQSNEGEFATNDDSKDEFSDDNHDSGEVSDHESDTSSSESDDGSKDTSGSDNGDD